MDKVVYVVYSYFPKREGVVIRKAFTEKAAADSYCSGLPTSEDGQECNNWVQEAGLR